MAFDATVLAAVVHELGALQGGRINKIYQPHPWELALLLYAGRENRRLVLSCHPQHARLHLTRAEKPNPPQPPVFCMLLRKHLEGGRILGIRQSGRERIACLDVGALDELGNPAAYTLVAELMSRHSNLVLLAPGPGLAGRRIIDAARRVTEEANAYREVLPGLAYVEPPATGKLEPTALTGGDLAVRRAGGAGAGGAAWQLLLDVADGLGPLVAREAAHRAGLAGARAAGLMPADLDRLAAACRDLYAAVDQGRFQPTVLYGPAGEPRDFAALDPQHWSGRREPFPAMSAALDQFFAAREAAERAQTLRAELHRTVAGELARARRKADAQTRELAAAEGAEALRVQGELLLAHLWQVPKGTGTVTLPNLFAPGQEQVTIALDPALAPAENAQAYFRRYQKARAGRATIAAQLDRTREELAYLEQVEATLAQAAALPDLEEVRRELAEQGYVKGARPGRAAPGGKGRGKGDSSRAPPANPPLVVCSTDGLEIWVGRNNRQNDALTTRLSAPTDLWLHTQAIPGAHVILRLPPGTNPPERSLLEAAALAAYYSKARQSATVPVDYTLRKHVRKPAGARPGMVIYEHQRTVYVTPDPEQFPLLR